MAGRLKPNTFEWLERTIEGLLNDFEGGITEKEETIKQFFELIFDKLVKEIQGLRDQVSIPVEKLVSPKVVKVARAVSGDEKYENIFSQNLWLDTRVPDNQVWMFCEDGSIKKFNI